MLDVFNIAKPQNCDIQTFYGGGPGVFGRFAWNKKRGVSNIYMLLIGGGGDGNGSTGGGSGAVTVWYGSAQNVPDSLFISVGAKANPSTVNYYTTSGTANTLLTANGTTNQTGATAMTANQFAASGFFQSIAGQNGSTGDPGASATTFLQGGGTGVTTTANYGYQNTSGSSGRFQMQPIIVGTGGNAGGGGDIGCGGGVTGSIPGGPGMVLIASW